MRKRSFKKRKSGILGWKRCKTLRSIYVSIAQTSFPSLLSLSAAGDVAEMRNTIPVVDNTIVGPCRANGRYRRITSSMWRKRGEQVLSELRDADEEGSRERWNQRGRHPKYRLLQLLLPGWRLYFSRDSDCCRHAALLCRQTKRDGDAGVHRMDADTKHPKAEALANALKHQHGEHMLTEAELRSSICSLGLSGLPVCLHSSLRSFGWVDQGASTIVEAFLAERCTVLVPTFADDFRIPPPEHLRPERNGYDYNRTSESRSTLVYTPESTVIDKDMGAIPQSIVNMPSRFRGNHPLLSFCAVGPLAAVLIAPQMPVDAFVPLKKLSEMNGVILLAGVSYRRMTLLHLAEKLAGRTPFRRWANAQDGQPMMVESGGCSEGFDQFAPVLDQFAKKSCVGSSEWIILPANDVLKTATRLIRETPDITRCANHSCGRCRDALLGGPISS